MKLISPGEWDLTGREGVEDNVDGLPRRPSSFLLASFKTYMRQKADQISPMGWYVCAYPRDAGLTLSVPILRVEEHAERLSVESHSRWMR